MRRHEGYRAGPYKDTLDVWTVGFGHNFHHMEIPRGPHTMGDLMNWLTDRGRHSQWLVEDVNNAINVAKQWLDPKLATLTDARQRVIAEMAYQLGGRLHGFDKMKAALLVDDYDTAADEGLRSVWAQQTPKRARELMGILRLGTDRVV